jgi:uncharacterized protein YjdB
MKGIVRTAAVGVGLVVAVGCLDDAPSAASNEQPVAIVLRAIADLGGAVDRDVGIRVYYSRSGGEQIDLPTSPSRVRVTGGETQRQAVSVQIATCLADPLRIDATEPGCRLNVELRLLDGAGATLDVQVARPESPSSPGQTVEVPEISLTEVASVRIAEVPTLRTQDTRTLTATALAANGQPIPGRSFVWTSSNAAVATITPAGTITAVAPGSTTISALTGVRSGEVAVRVLARVAAVSVTAPNASMVAGTSQQLTVVARDAAGAPLSDLASRTVTWQSSAPAVASVTAQGVVTAHLGGNVQITATVDGVAGSTTITTTVSPITVTPASSSIIVGRSIQLQANGAVGTVQWTSSDATTVSVSPTGLATARFPGSATITASTAAGQSAAATVESRALFTSVVRSTLESVSTGYAFTLTTFQAFDADNQLIPGVVPQWSVGAGAGSLSVTNDPKGWIATGGAPGSASLVAREARTGAVLRTDNYTVLTRIQGANGAVFVANDIGSSITLFPGDSYVIRIRVLDMTGKPQPNRIVVASGSPSPGSNLTFPSRARTDASGEATFTLVASPTSGRISVTLTFAAEGDGQPPATLLVNIDPGS